MGVAPSTSKGHLRAEMGLAGPVFPAFQGEKHTHGHSTNNPEGPQPLLGVSLGAHTHTHTHTHIQLTPDLPFCVSRKGGWEGDFPGWRVTDPRTQQANILKHHREPLETDWNHLCGRQE